MKILALDSSGLVASVAIWEDRVMKAEYTLNHKKTHSQTLLPMVDEVVKMTELDLRDLDGIAVAAGPGSFTGLRIGSATAKGLGQALGKPILEVPTVDALAYNLAGIRGVVCPMMDARRNQVYTGIYRFEGEKMTVVQEQKACSVQEICQQLNDLGEEVALLGDGIPVQKAVLEELLRVPHWYAPSHLACQRAGAIAELGALALAEGRAVPAEEHVPTYLRQSQAERERNERLKARGEQP